MFLQGIYPVQSLQRGPLVQLDPAAFIADPELVQALDIRATPIPCDEDRVLFRQGAPPIGLYILLKGETPLSMTAESGELIMSVQAAAGSLLGLPGIIEIGRAACRERV